MRIWSVHSFSSNGEARTANWCLVLTCGLHCMDLIACISVKNVMCTVKQDIRSLLGGIGNILLPLKQIETVLRP